jgi:S-adenosylmethionine:tRNA ribosyltransferase-isomerase
MEFLLSNYDFDLPKSLIAQYPLKERDNCRLLVLDRDNRSIGHFKFKDIINFMERGDLLVLNDTRVIFCRIFGICKETGGKVDVLLLEKKDDFTYKVLLRPARQLKLGKKFLFDEGRIEAELIDVNERLYVLT